MKLRIYIEVDVSSTLAETIQRNGFNVERDGSGVQIKVSHSPTIPTRKTRIIYEENPTIKLDALAEILSLLKRVDEHLESKKDGTCLKCEIQKLLSK